MYFAGVTIFMAAAATDSCIPLGIPPGQCWRDSEHRIDNGNTTVASPADCCRHCENEQRCEVYVAWRDARNASDSDLKCYLYSARDPTKACPGAQPEYHAGCLSKGCLAPVPPPPPPQPPYVPPHPVPPGAKDVLMIAIDDMRPELGCYDCKHMKTPHMDALAADAMVFDNAYVAVAWCSPSRTALLTSRRPDTTRTWSVLPQEYWRDRGGNFTTLPQYFRERGYLTLGIGKIFHPGKASGNNDVAYSWSAEGLPYSSSGLPCPYGGGFSPSDGNLVTASELSDMGGDAMSPSPTGPDDHLAPCGNRTLLRIAAARANGADKRPFFFSVGFHKPHIPWRVPPRYYDRYPLGKIELAAHRSPPVGVPSVAMNNILSGYWSNSFADFNALRSNGTITKTAPADNSTLDPYWSRRARQAYWAALSYTDDNVGTVVAAAKAAGLYDEAVVVLWGDHGYQLGENDQWSKVSNFEQATRIPLMIRVPAGARGAGWGNGRRSSALWEAVDLFPTLTDLAMKQVPPKCPPTLIRSRAVTTCTDGKSAVDVLCGNSTDAKWSSHAISQVPRGAIVNGEPGDVPGEIFMGYTVRTASWRYTAWVRFENSTGVADWSDVVGRELYPEMLGGNCRFDTDTVNEVGDPRNAQAVKSLQALLHSIVQQPQEAGGL